MTFRSAVLCTSLLAGCGSRPVQQTTITQLREQDALVLAPELPMGFGSALPGGTSSLSVGAGYTAAQALGDVQDVGQQVIPMTGLLRGAAGAGGGLEVVASGSLGSPNVDVDPLSPRIDGLSGVLGRGAIGMRSFLPLRGRVEWGFTVDLGAEASHLARTDTVTVDSRDRDEGPSSSVDSVTSYRIRTHPYARTGTVLRAPLPLAGITAVGGFQLQTWPVYWASKVQTETCTTYDDGDVDCARVGSIKGRPSQIVAVFTPTLGATALFGATALHVQGFANVGPEAVSAVPWGAMVMLEQVLGGSDTSGHLAVGDPDRADSGD